MALELYTQSAEAGEKIDSCIKDYASVLHQLGETALAVAFIDWVKQYYQGDMAKLMRLRGTLHNQFKPSGKHTCKTLLF